VTEPTLHIETEGSGPGIVLAHGFGGSARNFRPQVRALRDAYRIVTYDAAGHGRSAAPFDAEHYSLAQLVADFGRAVDSTGDAKVVAGGLSLGAATALAYALDHPTRVRGLLLASFPTGATQADSARRTWSLGFADAIRDRGLDAAGAEFAWGERSRFDLKGAELIRQGFLEHPPHGLEAILRNVLAELPAAEELEARLHALDIPALVIVGENDTEALEPSRRLVELLPRARLEIVPRAGHVVNLARPAEFNALARAFVDSLG
jgi:pimeloyl-ACP methyl ester carboxylesterase